MYCMLRYYRNKIIIIMPTCKEFVLDDLFAVTAIPIANIPASAIASPASQVTPTIGKTTIVPSMLSGSITIGQQPAVADGILIPIMRLTGKAKDEESDAIAGRLHTVTVNCQVDERDTSVWSSMLTLERTPSHLLLTFRDKSQAFVAATADTYLFKTDRDGAKTSASFRIENLMGIQMLL